MIRRPPRSTQSRSSAASDVYKRQVDERPVLEVLSGVGEVQAEQVRGPARAGVSDGLDQPDRLTAEGDREGAQPSVPADERGDVARVHGVVVPQLKEGDVERGLVAHPDRDELGVGGRTGALEHDAGHRLGAGLHEQVSANVLSRPVQPDRDGFGDPVSYTHLTLPTIYSV